MVDVVGVTFKDKGRIYYFLPRNLKLKKNVTVVVETERGLQFGKVVTDIIQVDEKKLLSPLKKYLESHLVKIMKTIKRILKMQKRL